MKSNSKSIVLKLLLFSLGINSSTFYYQSQADEIKTIIKGFCLESVKNEMITRKDLIYDQVAEHTCNCFLQRIHNGESLYSSKEVCKKETYIEFGL